MKALAVELRCLVCQNQTLADSNAPLAEDLRREVREMIAKDMSDKEIIDFLVSRYGDFVLYRPPWKLTTTLLWVGPFLLLGAGAIGLVFALRRRQKKVTDVTLSEAEHNRVDATTFRRSSSSVTILFWCIVSGMTLLILGLLLWPLLKRTAKVAAGEQEKTLSIFRQQFAELEQDRANGVLTDELYQQARRELERRLLEETGTTETTPATASRQVSSQPGSVRPGHYRADLQCGALLATWESARHDAATRWLVVCAGGGGRSAPVR